MLKLKERAVWARGEWPDSVGGHLHFRLDCHPVCRYHPLGTRKSSPRGGRLYRGTSSLGCQIFKMSFQSYVQLKFTSLVAELELTAPSPYSPAEMRICNQDIPQPSIVSLSPSPSSPERLVLTDGTTEGSLMALHRAGHRTQKESSSEDQRTSFSVSRNDG
jgi:hypothetical protein